MQTNQLLKFIKTLLYLLAFTPLIITPMTIFPFNFGRGLITQFLIEIIFFLYLALAIFDPVRSRTQTQASAISNGAGKSYRPRRNILIIAPGLFLFFLFISSVFGVHFFKSFWGSEERFSAWLYLLHIFAVFLVLVSFFKSQKEWSRFLAVNVSAGVLMFAIAALSLFGIKFWGVDLGTRISGTLGNPLFLGAYFVIVLIFALYLGLFARSLKIKFLWFLCAAIIFYGIILTQSRGALYGTIGGIMFGLLYYGLFNKNKKARAAAAAFMLIMIIVASAPFVFKNTDFVRNNGILKRAANLSFTTGTGNTRLMGWRVALTAIKERPLLGWGMEGFDVAFNKYYNPQFLKYSYYETWFDKPHNKILEVAVDGGLVALLFYLLIFTTGGLAIRKKEKRGELSPGAAAVLTGGLAAYFAQNLFVFDTAVSYLLFFILLAFINRCEQCEFNANDANNKLSPGRIPMAVVLLFLGLGLAAGWFTSVSPFLADAELRNSTALSELDDTKKINLDGYKQAMRLFNPYKEEWRADLVKSVLLSLKRGDGFYGEEEVNFSIEELKKNIAGYPDSAYHRMLLGSLYAELGPKDKKYFDMAKGELDKALELSPFRQHIYFNYGRLYGLMDDKENLIRVFDKAIELEPGAAIAYWEAGKQLYLLDPKDNLARMWIIKSLEMGYLPNKEGEFVFVFKNFYDYFLQNKNYAILSNFYERMTKIEPAEAKWHAQRAMAEYMLGRKESAIMAVQKAIEVDGSYKAEGEKFIRMIEAGK